MAQFEELQALWQSQTAPVVAAFDPGAMTSALHRLGRRHDIINTIKAVLVAWATYRIAVRPAVDPVLKYACLMLILTAAAALVVEWRVQRGIARLDFSDPSIDFVRTSIARLNGERNPYDKPIYYVLFGVGVLTYNSFVVAAYPRLTMPMRVSFHLAANALLVLIYVMGRWIRLRRWNRFYKPLVERLTVLLNSLEEIAA